MDGLAKQAIVLKWPLDEAGQIFREEALKLSPVGLRNEQEKLPNRQNNVPRDLSIRDRSFVMRLRIVPSYTEVAEALRRTRRVPAVWLAALGSCGSLFRREPAESFVSLFGLPFRDEPREGGRAERRDGAEAEKVPWPGSRVG